MSNPTPHFATLDKLNAVDPVEGLGTQFTVEFRDQAGTFIDRVHGTRQSCVAEAARRQFSPAALRVTGRANEH